MSEPKHRIGKIVNGLKVIGLDRCGYKLKQPDGEIWWVSEYILNKLHEKWHEDHIRHEDDADEVGAGVPPTPYIYDQPDPEVSRRWWCDFSHSLWEFSSCGEKIRKTTDYTWTWKCPDDLPAGKWAPCIRPEPPKRKDAAERIVGRLSDLPSVGVCVLQAIQIIREELEAERFLRP